MQSASLRKWGPTPFFCSLPYCTSPQATGISKFFFYFWQLFFQIFLICSPIKFLRITLPSVLVWDTAAPHGATFWIFAQISGWAGQAYRFSIRRVTVTESFLGSLHVAGEMTQPLLMSFPCCFASSASFYNDFVPSMLIIWLTLPLFLSISSMSGTSFGKVRTCFLILAIFLKPKSCWNCCFYLFWLAFIHIQSINYCFQKQHLYSYNGFRFL